FPWIARHGSSPRAVGFQDGSQDGVTSSSRCQVDGAEKSEAAESRFLKPIAGRVQSAAKRRCDPIHSSWSQPDKPSGSKRLISTRRHEAPWTDSPPRAREGTGVCPGRLMDS